MNILFICSRNKWRSLTAETIYKNHPDHQIRSAGTSPSARIKINEKLVVWADLILVMERKHQQILMQKYSGLIRDKKIGILNIPDKYQYRN